MTWRAVFFTGHSNITRRFGEEPEHREIEDYANRYGALSVTVYPPTKEV